MSGETAANHRPTITPPRYRTEDLPAELRETAWHAASVVRFFCSIYGDAVTGVRVNEDSFVVIAATVPGDKVIDVTLAGGPDGTCACKVSAADGDLASAAPEVRSFEQVLAGRLAEVGVHGRTTGDPG